MALQLLLSNKTAISCRSDQRAAWSKTKRPVIHSAHVATLGYIIATPTVMLTLSAGASSFFNCLINSPFTLSCSCRADLLSLLVAMILL